MIYDEWPMPANPMKHPAPIDEADRREHREHAIYCAVVLLGEADDLNDTEADSEHAERAVRIAKCFERYILDGL